MPVVIPPGFGQVTTKCVVGASGRAFTNVAGIKIIDTFTQTDFNNLSSAIGTAWKGILTTGSLFSGIRMLEGNDGPETVWESTSGAGAGTRATGTFQTPQVQFLIKKQSSLSGRKFQGRLFIPDVKESDVDDIGNVAAGTITALGTFITNITTGFANGSAFDGMVLLHQDDTVPTELAFLSVSPRVATLRKRYVR